MEARNAAVDDSTRGARGHFLASVGAELGSTHPSKKQRKTQGRRISALRSFLLERVD